MGTRLRQSASRSTALFRLPWFMGSYITTAAIKPDRNVRPPVTPIAPGTRSKHFRRWYANHFEIRECYRRDPDGQPDQGRAPAALRELRLRRGDVEGERDRKAWALRRAMSHEPERVCENLPVSPQQSRMPECTSTPLAVHVHAASNTLTVGGTISPPYVGVTPEP